MNHELRGGAAHADVTRGFWMPPLALFSRIGKQVIEIPTGNLTSLRLVLS